MKIHLGMPCYAGVHPEVVRNIVSFDLNSQERHNDLVLHFPQTSILSLSRNVIMRNALENRADWILMWDSDIQIKDNQFFYKLLEIAHKNDAVVVGIPCRLRVGDQVILNCANKKDGEYKNFTRQNCPQSSCEVDVVGTGLMLINGSWIKENWPQGPWFTVIDTPTGAFPEDWNFCEKVKAKGGRIFIDPTIKTVHWAQIGYAT